MNQKRKFKTDEPTPEYLKSLDVDVEHHGKITGHRLVANMVVSLRRGVSRPAGRYVFQYAEWNHTLGEHLLYVDRLGMRKCVRQADITKVHASRG